jgi:hypothetical protein
VPICLYCREERSGQTISLWRDELLKLDRAPFDIGPGSLIVAYASNAELGCFLSLGWPFPVNVLDAYVETIAAVNGNANVWPPEPEPGQKKRKGRPGLLDACELYGLPHMLQSEKDRMRDLILGKVDYTDEERREIQGYYNRADVDETVALLDMLAPSIDLPRALMRGRYMGAVARMERIGLPTFVPFFQILLSVWDQIKLYYIQRDDEFGLYEGTAFVEQRLWDLIKARGWDWPRTSTGRYQFKLGTLGKQAQRYPELKRLAQLRDRVAELKINKLANTIGADGFSRCPLLPYWTMTGRNQPSSRDKMFLPGLPTWLHGILKPPPGMALVELDYSAEEIGIMAGLSGDSAMMADYLTGDPYLEFGKRAGLIPPDGTKKSHPTERAICKIVCLGMNYGMTPYGIAAKTKKSLTWAREIHARHRRAYPVFHQWLGDLIAQSRFDGVIVSPFGWPQAITEHTKTRSLMNFPAQAGGGDILRLASIAATECGISIAAPVHDAFWVLAPLPELDETITRMRAIMRRAGELVAGIPIEVEVAAVVRWPYCLGDVREPGDRGQDMWNEIRNLVQTFTQQRMPNEEAPAAAGLS